jgi:hypothetical protein
MGSKMLGKEEDFVISCDAVVGKREIQNVLRNGVN